jgi:hypothetical protein
MDVWAFKGDGFVKQRLQRDVMAGLLRKDL